MADLIDRQAALKKLAVYIHLIDKTMGKGLLTDDDCMEAAKSVLGEDELPAIQPKTNWIPCSERLPEEGQKCLVCDKGGIGIDTYIGHGNPYNWKWYTRDYDAWMPLPEPYRGGEK